MLVLSQGKYIMVLVTGCRPSNYNNVTLLMIVILNEYCEFISGIVKKGLSWNKYLHTSNKKRISPIYRCRYIHDYL